MPRLLTDIVEHLSGGTTEELGTLLDADAAATERAIDAALPAILAGLNDRAAADPHAVLDVVSTYGHLGNDDDPGSQTSGGGAIADAAFGDDVSSVVEGIAAHVEQPPANVASMIGGLAGVVGSYLSARVAADDLGADDLAELLAAERDEFDAVGLAPLLVQWGFSGSVSPEDELVDPGFHHNSDAGRPAALWWVTGVVTLVLFAVAISQCTV